jgi:hypothetical protein
VTLSGYQAARRLWYLVPESLRTATRSSPALGWLEGLIARSSVRRDEVRWLSLGLSGAVPLGEKLRGEPQPFTQSLDLYRRGVDRLLQGGQLLPNRLEVCRVSAKATLTTTASPEKLVQQASHHREASDHPNDDYSRHLTIHLISH